MSRARSYHINEHDWNAALLWRGTQIIEYFLVNQDQACYVQLSVIWVLINLSVADVMTIKINTTTMHI